MVATKNLLWHLQKFQLATLELSKTNVLTICMVLQLYKMIQHHLMIMINDPDLHKDTSGLKSGLKKINKHLEKALVGDYL